MWLFGQVSTDYTSPSAGRAVLYYLHFVSMCMCFGFRFTLEFLVVNGDDHDHDDDDTVYDVCVCAQTNTRVTNGYRQIRTDIAKAYPWLYVWLAGVAGIYVCTLYCAAHVAHVGF